MTRPGEDCPFRFVLAGRECKCPLRGEHDLHRVAHPETGAWHFYEFVPTRQ